MKGCVVNKSAMWMHAMKRAVAPGARIPLDELYDQYGKKHDLPKGDPFIAWLKDVKLRDNPNWKIVLNDKEEKKEEKEVVNTERLDLTNVNPKKMAVDEVVALSVRQARDILPKVSDVKLLKYALQEAAPRSGKDTLCQLLRKRIRELETIRR
jgi:hypothetical protein